MTAQRSYSQVTSTLAWQYRFCPCAELALIQGLANCKVKRASLSSIHSSLLISIMALTEKWAPSAKDLETKKWSVALAKEAEHMERYEDMAKVK